MENQLLKPTPTDEVNALIYTRASMDRKYLMRSTGDQETDCRTWCDQQAWHVGKVITDANRSASKWRTREREGFEEALHLIESQEYAAFVTWEPSRAGRELLAFVQLRAACQEAGVLYLTKGRVYDFSRHDDSFMMGLEFLTAEKDAAIIRDRQLRTVRLHAQQGRPHGRLPYGYPSSRRRKISRSVIASVPAVRRWAPEGRRTAPTRSASRFISRRAPGFWASIV